MTTRGSVVFELAALVSLMAATPVRAALTSCATDWNNFNNPGFIAEYTYQGQVIADEETSADSSHGSAAVTPSWTDLASGSPGSFPGPEPTSFFGYYNGGTVYDPNDPATMEDDYILFRMRVQGDPSTGAAFDSKHWNVLLDVDGDGYKEYWVDLDGSFNSGPREDRLQILYDNANRQDIPDPNAARVDLFTAYNSPDGNAACTGGSPGLSHTRVIAVNDGTGDYWIEMQIPMTAFNDLAGNQVLYPDSPVAFVFSTGASNQDPLQKDFMQDLNFLTLSDPITFGDIVTPSGFPNIEFTDVNLNPVSFYSIGESVYVYLTDPASNIDPDTIECINATVTNPTTGDDESVTLCETGPSSGIFTNNGGACGPVITNPNPAPSPPTVWLTGLHTSSTTVDEDWTLTYDAGNDNWTVTGSVSGSQPTRASHGVPYTSTTGGISFTLFQNAPANGTVLSFCTRAADPLLTSSAGGSDNDGTLQVFSGDDIFVSFTNPNFITVTDQAAILGPCQAFISFTRATGLTATSFLLTADPATSDQIYVTVFHREANTNPATIQTISVVLTGNDTQTLTLTETGADTGEFRNTTGLQTKIDDGTVTPNDNLWEDIDTGVVTATYDYNCGGSSHSESTHASLFHTNGGGRVQFTNGAGTQDVNLYGADVPVWLKVTDSNACTVVVGGVAELQVTVTTPAGDSETVTLYETFPGSGIYMNRRSDLVTTAGSAVITSASSTFLTDGVAAGDSFAVATGPDLGTYTVSSVDSETQITLTTTLTASRTGIAFSATPLMTATSDGTIAADDGVLEANHDDDLTVSYTDCSDGDTDATNDVKVDVAKYNAPSLLINDVLFYPDTSASSCQTEAVQLYNASSTPVTATGYSITDEDGFNYTVPQLGGADIVLQPGQLIYLSLWNANPPNDFFLGSTYYLFTQAGTTFPSDQFADPGSADPADQISLFDSSGVVQDYVGWSSTLSPSLDFYSDDSPAVLRSIWQDDSFKNATSVTLGQSMSRLVNGFDTNKPSDWTFVSSSTCQIIATRALISSFRAFREAGRVVTEWETSSQDGTVGFYLYRFDSRAGQYVPVTKELVPALLDAPQGGLYRVVDFGARGDRLTYALLEVESGVSATARRFHGPYEVRVDETGTSRVPRSRGAREEAFPYSVAGSELERLSRAVPDKNALHRRLGTGRATSLAIDVRERGLYSLSTAEIAAGLGKPEATIRRWLSTGRIRLSNRGRSVAWTRSSDGSGLLFWGEALDSIYSNENVYWLESRPGPQMETAPGREPRPGAPSNSWFFDDVHAEEDLFPATLVSNDPESDYWYWTYISAGHPVWGRSRFTVSLAELAAVSTEAVLSVQLYSATDTGAGLRQDHHVEVSLNGTRIGEGRWGGIRAYRLDLPVVSSLLRPGDNVIEIEGTLSSGAPFSIFYVDSIDIRYPRTYRASGPSFVFHSDGAETLRVSGFDDGNVTVLDVTDPRRPMLVPVKTDETNDGYSVSFAASPDGTYAAVTPSGVRSPVGTRASETTSLRSPKNAFDYLVIAPAAMEAGAQRLADLRSQDGYQATVVRLEDVWDEFAYGISTPHAVRDFLAYAYARWARAPRFVVLVGAGDLDYKGRLGLPGNLFPPLLAATSNGLYASDNRFGDVDGDGWPEMIVGRIPAMSAAEMDAYVDKVSRMEALGMSVESEPVLMVADDDNGNDIFAREAESMASALPSSTTVEKIYLGDRTASEARASVLSSLSSGTSLFSYVGHGGLDRLADEVLLHTSDVPNLGNRDDAGIVAGFSCSINRFELAGYTSLGEALVIEPGGGATAVWAPSGLSLDLEAWRLGTGFFGAIFHDGAPTLGDAIARAFAAHRETGAGNLVPLVYNLLGDPAIRLR